MKVNEQFGQEHTNILAVMDLILTMSPSSAEAERGFSQLKLLKTPLRSRLNQLSLNYCLCIKLHSPSIKQFNPAEAIHHWNTCGVRSRRPAFAKTKAFSYNIELSISSVQADAAADADVEVVASTSESSDVAEAAASTSY